MQASEKTDERREEDVLNQWEMNAPEMPNIPSGASNPHEPETSAPHNGPLNPTPSDSAAAVNPAATAINLTVSAMNGAVTIINPKVAAVNGAVVVVDPAVNAANPAVTAVNTAIVAVDPIQPSDATHYLVSAPTWVREAQEHS